jgi:hypothetical protein
LFNHIAKGVFIMATKTDVNITSSDAQFAQQYSNEVFVEGVVKSDIIRYLVNHGVVKVHTMLSENKGGKVTLYDRQRRSSNGYSGDQDAYSLADRASTNSRTLDIGLVSDSIVYRTKGSFDNQVAAFNLNDGVLETMADWVRGLYTCSILNQLAGNNASSITQPICSDTAFSGSTLTNITGMNSATAPTYWYEAGNGGAITTASGVASGNKMSLIDFDVAELIINAQVAGRPTFQQLRNQDCAAMVIITKEQKQQLIREAVTLGSAPQLNQFVLSMMNGGKKVGAMEEFEVPGYPFKILVVPDVYLPRGVTTSGLAETANTRRAIIVGHNAVDVAFGAGYTMPSQFAGSGTTGGAKGTSKPVAGVSIEVDPNHKKLNNEAYAKVSLLWGCKKATVTGSGASAATSFDLAAYALDSYTAS